MSRIPILLVRNLDSGGWFHTWDASTPFVPLYKVKRGEKCFLGLNRTQQSGGRGARLSVMARKFSLNTAGIPTLKQVLVAVPSGTIYDHKVRETTGVVTLSAAEENDAATVRKHEIGGVKTLTEA